MPSERVIPPAIRAALSGVRVANADPCLNIPMDQGQIRRRTLYTQVTRELEMDWEVYQEDFDLFWAWYETDLEAGERDFDVPNEREGPGDPLINERIEWWTAQFSATPKYKALKNAEGRFVISATLTLIGEPFDIRVPPAIAGYGRDGDSGGAFFPAAPITADAADGDSGGWMQYVPTGLLASGPDGDSGGWTNLINQIVASGADSDDGGWKAEVLRGSGADGDSGGWVHTMLIAGGSDGDGGGWGS